MLGGALPLPARGGPEALPADERELRAARAAGGQGEEGRKKELLVERAQADFGRLRRSGEGEIGCHPSEAKEPMPAWPPCCAQGDIAVPDDERQAAEVPSSSPTSRRKSGQSPHTVKAYGRDLEAFTEFCDRHYGGALDLDDGGPARHARLPGRAAAARALEALGGARALGGAEPSTATSRCTTASPNAVARAAQVPKLDKRLPTYLDREQTERALRVGGGARRGRRVRRRPATSRCWSSSTPPASGCPS